MVGEKKKPLHKILGSWKAVRFQKCRQGIQVLWAGSTLKARLGKQCMCFGGLQPFCEAMVPKSLKSLLQAIQEPIDLPGFPCAPQVTVVAQAVPQSGFAPTKPPQSFPHSGFFVPDNSTQVLVGIRLVAFMPACPVKVKTQQLWGDSQSTWSKSQHMCKPAPVSEQAPVTQDNVLGFAKDPKVVMFHADPESCCTSRLPKTLHSTAPPSAHQRCAMCPLVSLWSS